MTPGFSAETSLYRSSLAYYGLAIAASAGYQTVQPAQDVVPAPRRIAPGIARSPIHALASGVAH
jgi:hypothetical protein